MIEYDFLARLLNNRDQVDAICPLCSNSRKRENRKRKVLRVWSMLRGASYCCAHCGARGYALDDHAITTTKPSSGPVRRHEPVIDRRKRVAQLWAEAIPPQSTWVEEYLRSRSLELPSDASMIRCHPDCPFPDRQRRPAMLVSWTGFHELVEGEEPEPVALHRIRGRGHDNKAMLGPVKRAAMMLTAPYLVDDELGVCEGFETGLALLGRMPIWALGSAGAIERFPIIARVRHLTIFADKDPTGYQAAESLASRYRARGRRVTIKLPRRGDFADA